MTLTNEQAQALGHRWIAAGGGWCDGMLAASVSHPSGCTYRITLVDADGTAMSGTEAGAVWACRWGYDGLDPMMPSEWWPDLRDAASRGAALEVLRERWMDGWAHIFFANGEWCLRVLPNGAMLEPFSYARLRDFRAASEAETLILALEAAPPVKP